MQSSIVFSGHWFYTGFVSRYCISVIIHLLKHQYGKINASAYGSIYMTPWEEINSLFMSCTDLRVYGLFYDDIKTKKKSCKAISHS